MIEQLPTPGLYAFSTDLTFIESESWRANVSNSSCHGVLGMTTLTKPLRILTRSSPCHHLASHPLQCCSASRTGQGKVCARKWVKFREKRKVPSVGQVQLPSATFSSFLALLSQVEPVPATETLPFRPVPFTVLSCQAVLQDFTNTAIMGQKC